MGSRVSSLVLGVVLATVATTTGTTDYALAADFMALRSVHRVQGGSRVLIEPATLMIESVRISGSAVGYSSFRTVDWGV